MNNFWINTKKSFMPIDFHTHHYRSCSAESRNHHCLTASSWCLKAFGSFPIICSASQRNESIQMMKARRRRRHQTGNNQRFTNNYYDNIWKCLYPAIRNKLIAKHKNNNKMRLNKIFVVVWHDDSIDGCCSLTDRATATPTTPTTTHQNRQAFAKWCASNHPRVIYRVGGMDAARY